MADVLCKPDWDMVTAHYAQYSSQDLETMCSLARCPKCHEHRECMAAVEAGREVFLLSSGGFDD